MLMVTPVSSLSGIRVLRQSERNISNGERNARRVYLCVIV